MKNQISFMSGLFDTAASTPPVANDRHFGEDLAKWFVGKSKGSEFVFSAPVQTADGWTDAVSVEGETFAVSFGLGAGSIGSDYAEWLVTIDTPRSWRSVGSAGSASRSRLCDHIHNVLRDERQVRELQWL